MSSNTSNFDWVIHVVANGVPCAHCGKLEYPFIDGICDAHTHGLEEKYGHPELFLCLDYDDNRVIGHILNTLGKRIRDGAVFHDGDFVDGIFEDCQVRLDAVVKDGKKVLKVIIPDSRNRWPEDPNCEARYRLQRYPLYVLETNLKHQH